MKYQFMRFPGGLEKAVTLSYDDGLREDLRFSDVISKAGLKCTFNLNSNLNRRAAIPIPLTDEEIREYFLKRGHEIAVHGEYHRAEGTLRSIEGIQDVLNCRMELEKRFGEIIRGMAYPDTGIRLFSNNASYEKVKNYLTELDIVYARTLRGDNAGFEMPTDWHAWMPTAHHENRELMEWIDQFVAIDLTQVYAPRRSPKLFYLWGHSIEFERNNNWDRLDVICEKLGGKKDIWYATNMEIYEYTQAYYALVYSADGRRIYNPTLFDIWFDIDGKGYKISPGETLCLSCED